MVTRDVCEGVNRLFKLCFAKIKPFSVIRRFSKVWYKIKRQLPIRKTEYHNTEYK